MSGFTPGNFPRLEELGLQEVADDTKLQTENQETNDGEALRAIIEDKRRRVNGTLVQKFLPPEGPKKVTVNLNQNFDDPDLLLFETRMALRVA